MTIRTPNDSYYVSGASGGQNHTLPFGADRFEDDDLFVYVWNTSTEAWDKKTVTTHYTVSSTQVSFTSGNIPSTRVIVLRKTDVDEDFPKADFVAGASIKAQDLDNNQMQALRGIKELRDQKLSAVPSIAEDGTPSNPKMYANLDMNGYKVVNQPAGYITSTDILDGTIATADVADSAITAAKLASDSVTTAKIANDAVNGSKIADDSINSEHYVDGSIDTAHIADAQITTAKIAADAVTAAKLADDAVVTANIVDANVTTAKIADSAVTTAKIADAELVELATMGGNTASALADLTQSEVQILDGATVTTAELNILDGVTATATELNQLDGNTLKASSTDFTSSTQFPSAAEIDSRITARIDPLGGFEAIADEDSFPATASPAGTVISIANANGLAVNSSGVGAGTRAGGSDAVVINGFPSTFNSTSLDDGIGLLVIATSTAHTYDFHRVVAKNEDVRQLSSDINDFKARYRIGSSNPTTDNDAGDLFFNTGTSKMLVYNATSSAWEEVQAVGDFFINTISSSSGTGGGSATFNGTAYRFTLSNAPTYAQQLLVSINGVVQKPNSGTSQPSEGFALDGSDIILAAAPATGADSFFITIGSSVGIGTPSDNTVTTAKLAADAVTGAKIADDAIDSEHYVDGSIDTAHLAADAVTAAKLADNAVVTANITDANVTTAKIADDAVTADKLANTAVTAGSYTLSSITVDAQGRITAASSGSAGAADKIEEGNTNVECVDTGSDGHITFDTEGSERMRVDSSGRLLINTTNGVELIHGVGGGLRLTRNTTGSPSSGQSLMSVGFHGVNDTNTNAAAEAKIEAFAAENHSGSTAAANLRFYTKPSGTGPGSAPSERMRIAANGDVGIGIAPAAQKLQVHESASSTESYVHITNAVSGGTSADGMLLGLSTSAEGIVWNAENTSLLFATNNAEKVRIDNSGRLLIGTSTSSGYSSSRLIISGNGNDSTGAGNLILQRGEATSSMSNGDSIGNITFGDESGRSYAGITVDADLAPSSDSPGRMMFLTTADGSGSATERMRIDSSGRLLVGHSSLTGDGDSAYSKVVVNGNTTATSKGGILSLENTATAISSVNNGNQIGQLFFKTETGEEFGLIKVEAEANATSSSCPARMMFLTTAQNATTPTERLRITKDGYIDIRANSSGDVRLQFNGNGTRILNTTSGGHLDFYTNSSVRNRFLYNGQGTVFSNQSRVYPQTDNAVDLGSSGQRYDDVFATNGTIQTSDSRLKHEVETSVLGIDFIKALRPVSYKWIEGKKVPIVDGVDENGDNIYRTDADGDWVYESRDGARRHWGFIAQEVKQAVDDANVDFAGWSLADKDDSNSTQSLRYEEFISPLTKALQEAIAKIETLETQNASLEARLTALEGGS